VSVSAWPKYMQQREWRPTDGDTRCQNCGMPNPVWWTEHTLWNAVMDQDQQDVLCPTCFVRRAVERGHGRSGAWQLYPPASLR
jgi:Zn finger protein HypA/HybF involved in hydrogenase expression